jgi:RNA polymerase sigma factor (sigma-70 family)
MQELDDNALLREYVERDSEEAFAALVTRHVNKVYSVALRLTGNPHSAEEITQAVFVILARKSRQLGKRVILSGWLYQTARLTAVTFIRGGIRRARREQEARMQTALNENESDAWLQIAPLLDAAMAGLNEADRHAVVLRFFDGKSLREVGAALGANEDAAKKRVSRALEKLRAFFAKRGVSSTTAIIAGAISANSVQAAPVALAKSVTAVAIAKGATAGGSTLTLIQGALKIMAWTKAKTAITTGTVVLLATVVTTTVVVQHHRTPPVSKTDLSASEVRSAVAALVQERLMWSQLTNLSAHITIESDKKGNGQITGTAFLEGDMKLRRIILSQAEKLQGYQRWEMVVSNTVDGWVWKTDGTPENTEVMGQNKQPVEQLEKLSSWNKEYPGAFVVPEQLLTMLYHDSLFSTGPSLDQILSKGLAIYRNQQAQGTLQSYVYKIRGGGQMSGVQFSFVNGHISGYKWPLGRNTQIVQSFEAPIESNHFWYPTAIHADVSDGSTTTSETIKLSNIIVNGPPM